MKNLFAKSFFIVFMTFLVSTAPAGNQQEFGVYISSEDQQNPDIYGNIIVWQQLVEGDWDIYGADISNPETPSVFGIAEFVDDQTEPAIYENTVVWQDYVETDWGIYGVDLGYPADVFVVADFENDQQGPDIFENTVVWQDNYFDDWDIYAADIIDPCNPQEYLITPFVDDQQVLGSAPGCELADNVIADGISRSYARGGFFENLSVAGMVIGIDKVIYRYIITLCISPAKLAINIFLKNLRVAGRIVWRLLDSCVHK